MDYGTLELPILEARPDWITCTAFSHERKMALYEIANNNLEAEQTIGARLQDWRFQSFRGFACGRWRVGAGKLGTICVVSGEQAGIAANILAETAEHWSRVDLCVTVLDIDGVLKPDEHYWQAWGAAKAQLVNPPRLTRHQIYDGGATITLGARASAFYTRVYNKHEESPGEYPKGSWRWEVEMKREASERQQSVFKRLTHSGAHCLNLISTEILRLGLSVPWQPGAKVERSNRIRYQPDADRLLGWLDQQVKPSAQFVAAARGRDAVLEVLDL
jgi:Replication initiation factor